MKYNHSNIVPKKINSNFLGLLNIKSVLKISLSYVYCLKSFVSLNQGINKIHTL